MFELKDKAFKIDTTLRWLQKVLEQVKDSRQGNSDNDDGM
jgi:hypothetical protein